MDRKNVESFIDEFKDLMKALNIDICHSKLQDKWFVFRTNGIYVTGYDFFFEVQDESDLAEILLSELSYDMHVTLGDEDVDIPECEKKNFAEIVDKYIKKKSLPETDEQKQTRSMLRVYFIWNKTMLQQGKQKGDRKDVSFSIQKMQYMH